MKGPNVSTAAMWLSSRLLYVIVPHGGDSRCAEVWDPLGIGLACTLWSTIEVEPKCYANTTDTVLLTISCTCHTDRKGGRPAGPGCLSRRGGAESFLEFAPRGSRSQLTWSQVHTSLSTQGEPVHRKGNVKEKARALDWGAGWGEQESFWNWGLLPAALVNKAAWAPG